LDFTVDLLKNEKSHRLVPGAMEFGPRALGNPPFSAMRVRRKMQSVDESQVKFRESFRPFAPIVAARARGGLFELDAESPYMLLVAPVKGVVPRGPPEIKGFDPAQGNPFHAAAITHVDYSARVQPWNAKAIRLLVDLLLRLSRRPVAVCW